MNLLGAAIIAVHAHAIWPTDDLRICQDEVNHEQAQTDWDDIFPGQHGLHFSDKPRYRCGNDSEYFQSMHGWAPMRAVDRPIWLQWPKDTMWKRHA